MKDNLIVKDRKWRSMAKAASWRIIGTVDTILISWIITHRLHVALSIGFVELFTKLVLYYFHERVWGRVKIGRIVTNYEI